MLLSINLKISLNINAILLLTSKDINSIIILESLLVTYIEIITVKMKLNRNTEGINMQVLFSVTSWLSPSGWHLSRRLKMITTEEGWEVSHVV